MLKIKRPGFLLISLLTGLILIATACGSKGGSNQSGEKNTVAVSEIKLGGIYPMSGQSAIMGTDLKMGMELAADIINNKHEDIDLPFAKGQGLPNLNNAKIKVIIGDHQNDPNVAASEAERLITQEKVVSLQGNFYSSASASIQQVTERLGIPLVLDSSSSPTLTERGMKWTFRTWASDAMFTQTMFDFAKFISNKKGIPIKTVGIIVDDSLYGQDSAKIARKEAERLGWHVSVDIAYKGSAVNLDAEVQKMKAVNPDLIYGTSYISDAILIVKTMKKINYMPKLFVGNAAGWGDPAFLEALGNDTFGFTTRELMNEDLISKNPSLGKIMDMFKQRTGRTMSGTAANAFSTTLVIADAINKAGSTKPEDLHQALLKTDIAAKDVILPALRGVKFDPVTHQATTIHPVMLQSQNGKFFTVYPENMATKEAIYPTPNWDNR